MTKISKKLQIKYSTAKTLVRHFKGEQIKINFKAFANETTNINQKDQPQIICQYQEIYVHNDNYFCREEEGYEINVLETN